jgi:MerR family mercuric resistance operon transcriptional regulator
MPRPDRTEGRHRAYDGAHVRRLAFICRARDLGFGIDNIRALLVAVEPSHGSCPEVREIASAHVTEVQTKLADLARLENILADTVSRCSGEQSTFCPVFEMLDAVP